MKFGVVPELMDIDNHAIHADVHEQRMLQYDYQALKAQKPELCAVFEEHVKAHKEYEARLKEEAAQNVPMQQN